MESEMAQIEFKEEYQRVKAVFPDAEIFAVDAQYEDFHAIVDEVRLIFYPHRVKSTGNRHIRLRNGTPAQKDKFLAIAHILKEHSGFSSTFSVKNTTLYPWDIDEKKLLSKYPHLEKYRKPKEAQAND